MIKEAIEKILSLSAPTRFQIGGREYSNQASHAIRPPTQDDLAVSTLTSIEDYYRDNPDGIDLAKTVVHIKDHAHVAVISAVTGEWIQRHGYLSAAIKHRDFAFGRYIPIEEFMIAVQTHFVQDNITTQLLAMVGNMTDSSSIKLLDDGITQQVEAKAGVRIQNAALPNPVLLAPYRTFLEVNQPSSAFVLRLKRGSEKGELTTAALFEADGGNWSLAAVRLIRDYLRTALPAGTTILG